jgi:hypothetical protein
MDTCGTRNVKPWTTRMKDATTWKYLKGFDF